MASAPSHNSDSSTTEARRYQILEPLGHGGFGTVYRAELHGNSGFKKQVAIKLLKPEVEGAREIAQRLRDEARILGLVQHRAIVRVDGLIQLDGRWAVVMEYVEGVGLDQLLRRGQIPLGVTLEIVEEVSDALNAVHTAKDGGKNLKLRHRDIKPSNIHITPNGSVKLLDFGVARADFEEREADTQSSLIGTWRYMAPECWEFEDESPADIYALGAVFYGMLAHRPLPRSTRNEVKHTNNMEEAVARLEGTCPPLILDLLLSMLAYDPDVRPNAREIQRACRNLRPHLGTPWLRDWAEDVVPLAIKERQAIEDDPLSGTSLTEQSSYSNWETATTRKGLPGWFALVGVVMGIALGAMVFWGYQALRPRAVPVVTSIPVQPPLHEIIAQEPTDATGNTAEEAPGEAIPPNTGSGVSPLQEPVEPPSASSPGSHGDKQSSSPISSTTGILPQDPRTTSSSRKTRSTGSSKHDEAAQDPSAQAPSAQPQVMGSVTVEGDLKELWLISGTRRMPPGSVSPGSYKVEVLFPDGNRIYPGTVVVAPGQNVTIRCNARFNNCRIDQ